MGISLDETSQHSCLLFSAHIEIRQSWVCHGEFVRYYAGIIILIDHRVVLKLENCGWEAKESTSRTPPSLLSPQGMKEAMSPAREAASLVNGEIAVAEKKCGNILKVVGIMVLLLTKYEL